MTLMTVEIQVRGVETSHTLGNQDTGHWRVNNVWMPPYMDYMVTIW